MRIGIDIAFCACIVPALLVSYSYRNNSAFKEN